MKPSSKIKKLSFSGLVAVIQYDSSLIVHFHPNHLTTEKIRNVLKNDIKNKRKRRSKNIKNNDNKDFGSALFLVGREVVENKVPGYIESYCKSSHEFKVVFPNNILEEDGFRDRIAIYRIKDLLKILKPLAPGNCKISVISRRISKSFIGRRISKSFDGIDYKGTITYYRSPYYRIVYEDKDKEDLDFKEVLQYLIK